MKLVVVTGLSGAGKSQALRALEDMGFYCVDNLPPMLIPNMARLCMEHGNLIDKVALGIDTRSGAAKALRNPSRNSSISSKIDAGK